MSDVKFIIVKDVEGKIVSQHDGYKTFMRELADKDFRKGGRKLLIEKSGKPFMWVIIDED